MHQSSLEKMKSFRDQYLTSRTGESLVILDIGSQDVNGSYKSIFDSPNWSYRGVDMAPGRNVDIVMANPYRFDRIRSASVDVVISGQAFEHIEYFWITMLEVARIMKGGALCCIIAPSGGPEHRFPVDCWRFYPDGLRALARYGGLEIIDVTTQWSTSGYQDGSNEWKDSVLIARKPQTSFLRGAKEKVRRWLQGLAFSRALSC